jgi:extracellular factor (EF) 3-hydroxypalmitic acid methyl ester biosynthesis protein
MSETKNIIRKEFKEVTNNLKNLYLELKTELKANLACSNNHDILPLTPQRKEEYFNKLKNLYNETWTILSAEGLEEDRINPLYQIYRNYFQKELFQFFLVSPFCKRVFEKPLGYAGDYLMMKYIYDNRLEGKTPFAKFVHNFSVNIEIAQAVRGRKDYLLSKILNLNSTQKFISSIACGPAVEIIDAITNNSIKNLNINLIDAEEKALNFVQKQLKNFILREDNLKIRYFNNSIIDIITGKLNIPGHDLIYSTGLFDYLSNKVATKLIERLFSWLNKGGLLIIGNLKSSDKVLRAYMDLLGEWYLNYRDEEELLKLSDIIASKAEIWIEKDPLDIQLYLLIRKTI